MWWHVNRFMLQVITVPEEAPFLAVVKFSAEEFKVQIVHSIWVILGMLQLAVVFGFRSTHRQVQSSQMMEWA